jgi:hypothetical protein
MIFIFFLLDIPSDYHAGSNIGIGPNMIALFLIIPGLAELAELFG